MEDRSLELLTEEERKLHEECTRDGGMTTDELIKRLSAVPYDVFQKKLKEAIDRYGKK